MVGDMQRERGIKGGGEVVQEYSPSRGQRLTFGRGPRLDDVKCSCHDKCPSRGDERVGYSKQQYGQEKSRHLVEHEMSGVLSLPVFLSPTSQRDRDDTAHDERHTDEHGLILRPSNGRYDKKNRHGRQCSDRSRRERRISESKGGAQGSSNEIRYAVHGFIYSHYSPTKSIMSVKGQQSLKVHGDSRKEVPNLGIVPIQQGLACFFVTL